MLGTVQLTRRDAEPEVCKGTGKEQGWRKVQGEGEKVECIAARMLLKQYSQRVALDSASQ